MAMTSNRKTAAAFVGAIILTCAASAAYLLTTGISDESISLALRVSGRVAFVVLIIVFAARPLQQLLKAPWTAKLLRNRKLLGVAFAWRSETTAGFHAVMNLVFLPMWLLSGAFFPPDGAAGWLALLMRVNPLTWCTQAIRGPLLEEGGGLGLGVAAGFAVVMLGITTAVIGRRGG